MKILLSNIIFSIFFLRMFPPIIQFLYLNVIIIISLFPIYNDLSLEILNKYTITFIIYLLLCFFVAYFHLIIFIIKKNKLKSIISIPDNKEKAISLKNLLLGVTCDIHQVRHNLKILYELKKMKLDLEDKYTVENLIEVYRNYMYAPKYKENSIFRKIYTSGELRPVKHINLLNFTAQFAIEDFISELQIIK